MIRNITLFFALIFISGCSSNREMTSHETKYLPVGGSLCDLYIKLDDQWVKFYEEIGDYSLIESPNEQYLVVTDLRGCYQIEIKVYDIIDRKLYDITTPLHSCLPSISSNALFVANRFVDDTTVEFGMNFLPKTGEEKNIVEALNKTVFTVNIEDLIVGQKYR